MKESYTSVFSHKCKWILMKCDSTSFKGSKYLRCTAIILALGREMIINISHILLKCTSTRLFFILFRRLLAQSPHIWTI
jgi:hypothetical protein